MNISSSSAGATAVSNATNSTQTKSTSSKSSSSTSFDEELKNASKTEESEKSKETENKQEDKVEDKTSDKKEDTDVKNNDKTNETLKGEAEKNQLIDSEELLSQNIQALLNTNKEMAMAQNGYKRLNIGNIEELSKTLTASIDYTTVKMDDNDALFFSNLVQNTDMSMQSVAAEIKNLAEGNIQQAQKTANVSATLMNALHEGMKTNQPFRIDFDKDISVIIKINKDGSIAANFIPGDKAVEEYLKNNLSSLKQRFDEQELSYTDLSYSRSRREQQQEENKRKNKENGNE